MSSKDDRRLQELDGVFKCMPHELVRLIRDYDLRPRHRFRAEPCLDSVVTLSQDQTEFSSKSSGFVAVRGERSFASAALHWSIKVPIGTRAWIGIVLVNSTHEENSFDFEPKDTFYLSISENGSAIFTSVYNSFADNFRTLAPYTTFTFAVDLDTQTLRIARNGIWAVDSFRTQVPNLSEATVYACLRRPGSLTLESTDE